jgi:O-antigen/teichoic acid export membrane protein
MRQVMRRFFVLASTSLFTQAIALVAIAFVTRRIGPAELGSYTVALAIVTFIGLPQTQGMTMVGTRDVAQNPSRVREIAGEVLIVQLMIAVVGFIVIVLLAPVLAPNASMQALLPIVAVFLFTGTSFEWVMQALGRMREIAVARVVGQVAYGLAVPVLVTRGLEGARIFAWLMIAGLAIKHLILDYYMIRRVGMPRLRISRRALRRRVSGSVAIGYTSVIAQIYGTIDQIMVGYFSSAADAGLYAVAYRIPNAVGTFAGSWGSAVFPHSAHLAVNDRQRLRADCARMMSAVALFALPLAACTPFIAHDLLAAAFGAQYGAGAVAFSLLTVTISIGLMNGTFALALRGMGKDRFFAGGATLTMLVNVIINLIAIPLYGRNGAATASIISELLGTALLVFGAKRMLGGIRPEWWRLSRIALAVCPAVLALALVPASLAVWVRIPMATVIYLAATVLFGAVARTEIRSVLRSDRPAPRRRRAAEPVDELTHA